MPSQEKKPYSPPTLTVWGTLRDLTRGNVYFTQEPSAGAPPDLLL